MFGVANQNQQSISQLVELPEHHVVEEFATPMACTDRHRRAIQAHSEVLFPPVDQQEPYIVLIDMAKIIRHNPYEWSDYVQKVSSIIFRHNNATHIICVNDRYDTAYSTKDDKRDLRVQGRAHVPTIYMKFKLALWHQQQREANICKHLTQSADAEIVYSVGSDCTNLSTQESMPDYSFSQSEANTILISAYAVLLTVGPVVISSADTDIYVAAAISQKLPGLLCIKRKQATILCHNLVPGEMAD